MDHTSEVTSLAEHDKRSDERTHYLAKKMDKLATEVKEVEKMEVIGQDNTAAIIAAMMGRNDGGTGAGLGAGLGGGLLGGILSGALLGNRNLLGTGAAVAEVGAGVVTPAMLTSGLASVIDSNQNTTLLQSVGDVKAAVPLAEAQVQLALAGAQADIMSQSTTQATAAALANQLTNQNIANAIASSLASQAAIKETVAQYGVANLTATKDAQAAIMAQASANTNLILTALKDNEITNLNRQLTVSELRNSEDRAAARSRETEVNVTQTVNQNQVQLQQQQQQQQIVLSLAQLAGVVGGLQNAVATNSNLIVGNTGAVATGTQTANPVNVRA